MTIISVLRLPAHPGADLATAFARLEIFEHSRRSGGFLGGRLLRSVDGDDFLVIAEWVDAAAYQGWLDNPIRPELGEQLMPMLTTDDVTPGELFEEME
jgi:heme-degrading monooxygenase HmoA